MGCGVDGDDDGADDAAEVEADEEADDEADDADELTGTIHSPKNKKVISGKVIFVHCTH